MDNQEKQFKICHPITFTIIMAFMVIGFITSVASYYMSNAESLPMSVKGLIGGLMLGVGVYCFGVWTQEQEKFKETEKAKLVKEEDKPINVKPIPVDNALNCFTRQTIEKILDNYYSEYNKDVQDIIKEILNEGKKIDSDDPTVGITTILFINKQADELGVDSKSKFFMTVVCLCGGIYGTLGIIRCHQLGLVDIDFDMLDIETTDNANEIDSLLAIREMQKKLDVEGCLKKLNEKCPNFKLNQEENFKP